MLKSITVKEAGRKGGLKRAQVLTPERRTEIASKAGKQRWRKKHDEERRAEILGEG